jgi:hypothetical protein
MNSSTSQLVEGHLLHPHAMDERSACDVCDESGHDLDVMLHCAGCPLVSHARCAPEITVVCANAFRPDQVRAAFVRCFASLLYTYRRHLCIADHKQRRNGLLYAFNSESFLRSLPSDCTEFVSVLLNTQCRCIHRAEKQTDPTGFNEFIHEREMQKHDEPSVRLFDQIILSKKNRGARSAFRFGKQPTDFLSDTGAHLWRTAAVAAPTARFPGDYRQVILRVPAKLDAGLMREPRVLQGVPRASRGPEFGRRRKPLSGIGIAS